MSRALSLPRLTRVSGWQEEEMEGTDFVQPSPLAAESRVHGA